MPEKPTRLRFFRQAIQRPEQSDIPMDALAEILAGLRDGFALSIRHNAMAPGA